MAWRRTYSSITLHYMGLLTLLLTVMGHCPMMKNNNLI